MKISDPRYEVMAATRRTFSLGVALVRESVKKRIFYGQACCKGGGISHLGPDRKQM